MTGADIRAFRVARGLTPEEFGKLLEPPVARQEINKFERAKRPISAGMRARLILAMARATPAGEG
jgi:transcriptional regulator with XRE-family HTH domain